MEMTDRPPVAIIILTWNALAYTRACVDALTAQTDHPAWRLVMVDNGSTDGTVEYLQGLVGATVVLHATNLGFTRGCNAGLAVTRPDEDVVLMNNDIVVTEPGWLTRLQDVAYAKEDTGVVGTRLVDGHGRINHLGSYMPPVSLYGQQLGGGERDINQCRSDDEIECVVFAQAYLRRACIDRVGPLDEDLFAYFDDTDYCFRARQAGFGVVYAGSVCSVHHHNTSTRENNTDFWPVYEASRKVFRRNWSRWVDHDRFATEAVWHSTVSQPLGYALTSRKIMRSLHQAGVRLAYRNAYGAPEAPTRDPLLDDLLKRRASPDVTQLAYCQADAFGAVRGRRRVGWSMLEVTGLPRPWVDGCNSMDEVWVPATFNVETFRASGVTVPIRVMPLGLDIGYLNPGITGFRPSGRFTFLSVFEWGERKAPEILLHAFAEEFKESEDVMLLLAVYNRDPTVDVRREVARLELPPSAPVVLMVNPEFADYQMGSLYRSADCFVLPTRGEGWGMPVLEAMACGLPAIATNWSGLADFLTADVGYPLDVAAMVDAEARCPHYDGFQWAEPDAEHLRFLLRHVFDNPEEARAKGMAAAAEVARTYTLQHMAARAKARLLELA
jgi:GT2 family glycosyltransferase